MNLNYSIGKTISLLINSIQNYFIFKIIIVCSILLFVILHINKKYQKYIVSTISFIMIIMIMYFYHQTMFSKETFEYIMHNIRFYFFNSMIFLIIISLVNYIINKKIIINIMYCLTIILLSFSIFMTHYVHNVELITLGNIYPMIVYGNYLYIITYLYLIIYLLIYLVKKRFLTKHS